MRKILLIIGWLIVGFGESQAQYSFMPNARRLAIIDSLRGVMRSLHQKPASFQRDTALFYSIDRYRYHYFDLNRPFAELTRTMLVLPDSMHKLAARHNWQTGLIIAGVRRADAISYLGEKVSAVRLYKEAIYRCQRQPLPHYESIALINLAACFAYRRNVTKQDWQQTVTYMKQALVVAKRSNDVENIHQYYNLMGDFHVISKRYPEALSFYEAEQPLMDKHRYLSGYRTNLAYLGICYLHTNQETRAWTFLNRFFAVSNTNQGSYATYLHFVVLSEIGTFYLRQQDYPKALFYLRQYEQNLNERTLFDRIGHYEAMSQIYGKLKNYAKAYQYQQQYLTIRDSLKLDETGQRFATMQTELALQRNQNQINALQNQSLLQDNRTQQNRLVFLAIIVSLLIVLLGMMLYSIWLRKKALKTERELSLEQREADNRIIQTQETEQQRIAQDLHDDLGGTLATIRQRLAYIRQQATDPDQQRAFADLEPLIIKSGQDLRRIAHNLMPPDFERLGLVASVEQLVRAISPRPTRFEFVASGTVHRLPVTVELNVYRIVSELVQNIQKHAGANRASVQLLYEQNQLIVMVEDDGVGILPEKLADGTGIGLKNAMLRANYIGANVQREAGEGGTFVVLEVPYPLPNHAISPRMHYPHR